MVALSLFIVSFLYFFVYMMTVTKVNDLGKMFFPFFGFWNIDRYWHLC